ncbi:MAG: hypothetical protein NTY65_01120 [Planctomycetota bacterium]|nr:hypothetical protein [Planctomycetota bacterium]
MTSSQMGVAKLIRESVEKLSLGDAEGSLIPVCIAVDATGGKVYPRASTGRRFKAFVRDNLALITTAGFGGCGIRGLNLGFSHPKLRPNSHGCSPFEDILYVIRCSLIHEGDMPSNITFGPEPLLGGSNPLKIPRSMIVGLIVAVVCSPANAGVNFDTGLQLNFGSSSVLLRGLRGRGSEAVTELREAFAKERKKYKLVDRARSKANLSDGVSTL